MMSLKYAALKTTCCALHTVQNSYTFTIWLIIWTYIHCLHVTICSNAIMCLQIRQKYVNISEEILSNSDARWETNGRLWLSLEGWRLLQNIKYQLYRESSTSHSYNQSSTTMDHGIHQFSISRLTIDTQIAVSHKTNSFLDTQCDDSSLGDDSSLDDDSLLGDDSPLGDDSLLGDNSSLSRQPARL